MPDWSKLNGVSHMTFEMQLQNKYNLIAEIVYNNGDEDKVETDLFQENSYCDSPRKNVI